MYKLLLCVVLTALYQYCKDIADQDCKRWLCLVNLSMHVREGITRPTQKSYCDVLKCYKVNGKLFGSGEFHKKMLNELILSVSTDRLDKCLVQYPFTGCLLLFGNREG